MKGQLTEIRFDATYNKGNYENEKIGLSYVPFEGENVLKIIEELRAITRGERTEAVKEEVVKEAVKEEVVKEAVKEEVVKEAVKEEVVKEVVKEEVVEKAVKSKAVKVIKSKATPYDRLLDVHKKLLSSFLDSEYPSWKQAANLVKAGQASTALVGTDYLDAEGNILDSFKEAFLAYLRN